MTGQPCYTARMAQISTSYARHDHRFPVRKRQAIFTSSRRLKGSKCCCAIVAGRALPSSGSDGASPSQVRRPRFWEGEAPAEPRIADELLDHRCARERAEFFQRLRVTNGPVGTGCSLVKSVLAEFWTQYPAAVHRPDLTDKRLHPRVTGRHVDHVTARERRPPQADSLCV